MGTERMVKMAESRGTVDEPVPQRAVRLPAHVQRALVVGSSNDPAEVEADRVAEQVVGMLGASTIPAIPEGGVSRIRRATAHGATIGAEGGAVDADIESRIQSSRGSGTALPANVGGRMQEAFGADFGNVRIHDDAEAHDLSRSIQARAFTTQQDIYLGKDAPSLGSPDGTKLLAHELTHVVQQGGGARRSTIRRVTAPADPVLAVDRKKKALAAHAKDRAALMKYVKAGAKSSDRRTANACEWILDGRTKLYALSATGDSDERIAHLGESRATTETWFPKGNGGPGDLKSAVAEYNHLDLDDQTNICVDTDDGPSTNGWNGAGYVAVMLGGGKMKQSAVYETLRHEVQHDADKNREKKAAAVALPGDVQPDAGELAKCFEGYKTEYRAYNYENSRYMKLSPTKMVVKYNVRWTERQLEIFEQIHDGYSHTKKFWDDSFETQPWATANAPDTEPDDPSDVFDYHNDAIGAQWKDSIEKRRQALVDYVNPDDEGFNKYDSIRVDDFYTALDAIPVGTTSTDGKLMSSLSWKTGFLGKKDALYILEESPDMRKKMKRHLADEAYVHVFKSLCTVAGVKKATPIQDLGKSSSPVIQAFSEALEAVPLDTADPKHATIRALRFKTAKLSKKEAKLVLNHDPKLLNKLERHVAGQARIDLMQLLEDCVG